MPDGRSGVTKGVILARGLGTRMRRADPRAVLAPEQETVAASGIKGLMPVGRPFLDYVLSALADAGYRDACLVIGPEHDAVRRQYAPRSGKPRIRVHFAVQERPLGTADAVLAAESFVGGDAFLAINSDNYYPVGALARLREHGAPALAGFDRASLVRRGNITADRIASFAIAEVAPDGCLRRIVEKPVEAMLPSSAEASYVSMNCWLFMPEIFEACRRVSPSPRGELELPHAVQWLVDERGVRFTVLPTLEPVLDLSSRSDIAAVAARLEGVTVRL